MFFWCVFFLIIDVSQGSVIVYQQIWPDTCFVKTHQNGFNIFNALKWKNNISWHECHIKFFKAYEIQMSVPINSVLLENSHTHMFTYCLWLPLHYSDRGEPSWQKLWPTKPKIFTLGAYPSLLCLKLKCREWSRDKADFFPKSSQLSQYHLLSISRAICQLRVIKC